MATKKPKGLGMGLEALLGPTVQEVDAATAGITPTTLPLSVLVAGKYQPRTRMDEGALYELAESIRQHGIMQPVLVRRLAGNAHPAQYEIIAGERRCRAAKLAGLESVPVLVREVEDQTAAAMALIENMQREDLNPLEVAQGLQRLIDEFGLTHEAAAQSVGRSRSAASNLLRLLNLATPVQTMLMAGDIDMGHARALLVLDKASQITAANQIVAKKLSVRAAESWVKKISATPSTPSRTAKGGEIEKSADLRRVEEYLSDTFATAITIDINKRIKQVQGVLEQGEIRIQFSSLDALNGLIERLAPDMPR